MGVLGKVARFLWVLDNGGIPEAVRETRTWLRQRLWNLPAEKAAAHNRQVMDYRYIAEPVRRDGKGLERVTDPASLEINWVIPPMGKGSGGHLNIFRMIRNLEELGHRNRLYVAFPNAQTPAADEIKQMIDEHFIPIAAPVQVGLEGIAEADVTFATSWQTAYSLRQVENTLLKAYFVQDFEPHFYPMGSEWYFAEQTYRFGYYHVTAGPWLAELLRRDYHAEADFFPLSFDRELYRPCPVARTDDRFRVFYYSRPVTPRRCFELGMLALELFYQRYPGQVEIVTAGWEIDQFELPFPATNLGILPLDTLPELYSGVDVALVNSSTNCSLLPMEVAACGTPVIDLDVPNVVGTLQHGLNAYLAPPTPLGIAKALEYLKSHPAERMALAEGALRHVQSQPSWEDGARIVEQALLRQLERRCVTK